MAKLEALLESVEIFKQSYLEDCTAIVFDKEKVVAFSPGSTAAHINIPIGTPIERFKGSISEKALITGEKVSEERGAEQYGIPYIGTATPIIENGEVVGVFTAMFTIEKLDALRSGAAELSTVIEEMSASTQAVAASSQEVSDMLNHLKDQSVTMTDDIEKVNSVLEVIHSITSQSHLLGLNAAIEAARAGEHGRGFSIVANEIRKMAENSKSSVQNIQTQLASTKQMIHQIHETISKIADQTVTHAASMQEMNSAYAHITDVTERLMEAARLK